MAARDGERLLSIEQVADILGVHPETIRRMVRRKELPSGRKIHGRLVRWFKTDIDHYLHDLRDAPPAEPEDDEEDTKGGK